MSVITALSSRRQKRQPCCFQLKWIFIILLLILLCCLVANVSLMLRLAMRHKEDHDASTIEKIATPLQLSSQQHPIVIGHAVSLIKCGKVSQTTGFLDAAAVLRHSIHLQSIHNNKNASSSRYSYQMYALVHEDCRDHASILESLGYKTLVVKSPVLPHEIKGEWYRNHVEGENCCGSKEFIKLYAYNLTDHPIVVHWDMDVALLKPMDDLFDAMMFSPKSQRGKLARSRLELQHFNSKLPDRIDAFYTKDVTSAQPWESQQGVQGGFLVARPDSGDLQSYLNFIREGNYVRGRGDGSGWGGLGYGGFQGAMAYQGVVSYFYNEIKPNSAVELNACRWNNVVADVLWRGPARMEHHLKCRQRDLSGKANKTDCEDCRITPVELTNSIHYTACKKPWECLVPHPRKAHESQRYRLSHLTNITTCMKFFSKWFELRRDFEGRLQKYASVTPAVANGQFEKESFLGYCKQSRDYIPMEPPPKGMDISKMYGM